MQLSLDELLLASGETPREKNGAVYTRAWVVDLILDLAGYVDTEDLACRVAVEPAAGEGAFLVSMVRRLVRSCARFRRPISDAAEALQAYELDDGSAHVACDVIIGALVDAGIEHAEAARLAHKWVRVGDYLLAWPYAPAADYVIGNPPYIRLEDVPEEISTAYRKRYRTMVGRADVYVAFFEAALQQLKDRGVCGFICADRWMLNHYGTELRRFVSNGFSVETVIEMHRADAFRTSVSAYPAITIMRKAAQGSTIVASAGEQAGGDGVEGLATALAASAEEPTIAPPPRGFRATRVDSWFTGSDPWPCTSPERLALLKRLEGRFGLLEDPAAKTRVGIGVATGADGVFITKDPTIVESSRLVPLAMAADTRDGTLRWSGHYLVDPWERDGRLVDLGRYPRLHAYLLAGQLVLKSRHVAARRPHSWYRTIDRVHHDLIAKSKIYIPDIKGTIHPVLDPGETYPHHNLYFVHSNQWNIEVLGGLLMSSVAQFFIECYAVRMRGGSLRFQAQYLRRIRTPDPSAILPNEADALIAAFRSRDLSLADSVAFALYGIDSIPPEEEHGS